ncbi:MAG: ATP-binding cassette domain-containing protein [Lachnospiraceae bacterium]|nr:ATP-binding cassette domain-containing protein [Lachnospiraceae bacterium]
MKNNNIVLSGKNIVKTYGEVTVLNGLNISIYQGDFTVIMGSSGSGKSTLLYMLSGMDQVTDGEVNYNGKNLSKLSEKKLTTLRGDAFGFVFQKTHLVSNLTLYENILMAGLVNSSMSEAKAKEQTEKFLQEMNLIHVKNHLPSEVSGGQAQRAAVARAVMGSPQILFADEPTGALNRANTKEVLNLLTNLHKNGQTILLVTHDREAALRGNRILYIEDGDIISELCLSEYQETDKEREEKLSDFLGKSGW